MPEQPKSKGLSRGRISRVTKMARLGLRTGASLLVSDDGEGAAREAARVLGSMRGLAAKIGQMASYVDGVVPQRHREAYEQALSQLQSKTISSTPAQVCALIEQELGAPVDELFAEFDREPFASASIGQVHLGRLHSGEQVAVKVQHPGIEQAVDSDLKNIGIMNGMALMLAPVGADGRKVVEEVEKRFREELDYVREAESQRWFAQLHAHDDQVCVPKVIAERSSRRVLTSEFVEGMTLDEACQQDEPMRRHYAEVMWRFVQRGNLVGGKFNADPHPGNFMFRADGSVVFLDFGSVQPLSGQVQKLVVAMHVASHNADEATFRTAAREVMCTDGGSYEKLLLDHTRRSFEPLFASPFHLTRAYAASLVESIPELKMQVFAKDRSFRMPPPELAMLLRLQFGFYSVLARLDVVLDYADIERSLLAQVSGHPAPQDDSPEPSVV